MGLNRNTPKAIIHGPREFGGCGIFDIYTEQAIQHIRQTQKHLRRNDNVGKSFLSNLNAYAIVIGSRKNFLTLNPWNY